jgi:hypothetical protein
MESVVEGKKKEDPMYVRKENKRYELEKKYFMRQDVPTTAEQLIAKIKEGKYTLDEKSAKVDTWNPMSCIEWRAPDQKKDEEGYEKALKLLTEAFMSTKDAIVVSNPTDGLNQLNKFVEKTIH